MVKGQTGGPNSNKHHAGNRQAGIGSKANSQRTQNLAASDWKLLHTEADCKLKRHQADKCLLALLTSVNGFICDNWCKFETEMRRVFFLLSDILYSAMFCLSKWAVENTFSLSKQLPFRSYSKTNKKTIKLETEKKILQFIFAQFNQRVWTLLTSRPVKSTHRLLEIANTSPIKKRSQSSHRTASEL